jgi:hypothetical protein
MPKSGKIIELRQLLAARFPQQQMPVSLAIPTGIEHLDASLEGGLSQGSVVQVVAPLPSCGSALLLHTVIAATNHSSRLVALVDGKNSFDPGLPALPARLSGSTELADVSPMSPRLSSSKSLEKEGLQNPTVLWVRCTQLEQAAKAVDLLIRDHNIALTILDFKLNPIADLRKIPATTWYRWQRVTSETQTSLLFFTPTYISGSSSFALALTTQWQLSDLTELSTDLQAQLDWDVIYRKHLSTMRSAEA